MVIDDDLSLREMMDLMLRGAGHQVALAEDGASGLKKASNGDFELIISDIKMPGFSGLEVLKHLRGAGFLTPLVLVSAYAKPDTAVEAMCEGAYDFIPKPFNPNDLLTVVDAALAHRSAEQERRALAEMVTANKRFGHMVGSSPAMFHVYDLITRAGLTNTSILITGESGTGKELVAKSVHENSERAEQPFVAINCGGIPENLVESELFGHKKGAFTGAATDKKGLVAIANGGTLFLDELGELPLPIQVKLLRVIQEKAFRPVGGNDEEFSDVRFISATNRNLETEIIAGRFREDLYYRLNVINIQLPPLRERPEDIPLLAQFFLEKYSKSQNKDVRKLSAYALDILSRYHFPGNVRELENIIERSVALEQSNIILPESLRLADFKRTGLDLSRPAAAEPGSFNLPSASLMSAFNPTSAPCPPPSSGGGRHAFTAAPSNSLQPDFQAAPPIPALTPGRLSPSVYGGREAQAQMLAGLPQGGIEYLLSALEGYYLYRAMFTFNNNRGRTATALAISPWRLRSRLVSCRLADLNKDRLLALGEASFPKPELPEGLAPDWSDEEIEMDAILLAVERHFIQKALTASNGNKTEAAALLGVSRRSFQHRLDKTHYLS